VPTCPRCKLAFLDGETHACQRKSRRATVLWICGLAVIYAAFAYQAGSVLQPGAVAMYMVVVAILLAGHWMANVLHLLLG
jgi:hypothetical protein